MNDLGRDSKLKMADSRLMAWLSSLNWLLALSILIGVWVWIFFDPQFQQTVAWTCHDLSIKSIPFADQQTIVARADVTGRILILKCTVATALVGMLGVVTGLAFGSRRFRSIAAWLGCMFVVSGWIALMLSWPEVAWQGKRFRLANQLETFEKVAVDLRGDWPLVDGEVQDVGYCSAYPYGAARVLVVLAPLDDNTGPIGYQAIERSDQGGLRFQLIGIAQSDWLEWHPDGEQPKSFKGGLDENYSLAKSSPIRDGWYLARYQSASSLRNESE